MHSKIANQSINKFEIVQTSLMSIADYIGQEPEADALRYLVEMAYLEAARLRAHGGGVPMHRPQKAQTSRAARVEEIATELVDAARGGAFGPR